MNGLTCTPYYWEEEIGRWWIALVVGVEKGKRSWHTNQVWLMIGPNTVTGRIERKAKDIGGRVKGREECGRDRKRLMACCLLVVEMDYLCKAYCRIEKYSFPWWKKKLRVSWSCSKAQWYPLSYPTDMLCIVMAKIQGRWDSGQGHLFGGMCFPILLALGMDDSLSIRILWRAVGKDNILCGWLCERFGGYKTINWIPLW